MENFFAYEFMHNAFFAVLLVTPLFGLLSTMVVSNRMAFFADSLGHGAFTGIAVGAICGMVSPRVSLVIFSALFAVFVTYIKSRSLASTDTVIGVFSSTAIAIGLMIMSRGGGFNKFSSYLIGDILSVTRDEIVMLAVVFAAVMAAWGVLFNPLLMLSINAPFARSRGINVFWIEAAFASLVAVVVAVSIEWVGILIINSLLVLPGAVARNVASDVKSYTLMSVAIALVSGVAGLIIAYLCDVAAGATIALAASAIFFVTMAARRK